MVWWAYSSCNKSHGAKGRGIESQSFFLLLVIRFLFNPFHVANDLSTQTSQRSEAKKKRCDGSVEKGTPGETRKKDRQAFQDGCEKVI